MSDYYAVLGVDREASLGDIQKAFRRLAVKHHPDRGGDTAVMQEISHAYTVLSDPAKRAAYDRDGSDAASNEDALALEIIGALLEQTYAQVNDGPITTDVVATMLKIVDDAIAKIDADTEKMRQTVVRLSRYAGRFGTKNPDTPNVMRAMVDNRVQTIERNAQAAAILKARNLRAKEIIQRQTFEVDAPTAAGFFAATGFVPYSTTTAR